MLYTSDSNRANNVPVEIAHSGEISQVLVNQRTGGGQWFGIGIYHFTAGTGNSVTISNTGTNGFVIVDAVRFTLIEPDSGEPPEPDRFEDWISLYPEVPAAQRGKLATPLGDGQANFLKYALGLGPLDEATHRLPTQWTEPGEDGHTLYFRYSRIAGGSEPGSHHYTVNDLVYRISVSTDLVDWTFPEGEEGVMLEQAAPPEPDSYNPSIEHVTLRLIDPLPPGTPSRAFIRLSIEPVVD